MGLFFGSGCAGRLMTARLGCGSCGCGVGVGQLLGCYPHRFRKMGQGGGGKNESHPLRGIPATFQNYVSGFAGRLGNDSFCERELRVGSRMGRLGCWGLRFGDSLWKLMRSFWCPKFIFSRLGASILRPRGTILAAWSTLGSLKSSRRNSVGSKVGFLAFLGG